MSVVDIQAERTLEEMPAVAEAGETVSKVLHRAILSTEPTRKIADILHGAWLGHPLHVTLTDFTIGAWAMASIFDAAGALADDDELRNVADHLTTAGTLSAVPTAVTGLVEYSTIPQPSAATATLHGLLNAVNFGIFSASVVERRRGNHTRGAILSAVGFGMTLFSAWLGGKLVYTYKLGVDHSDKFKKPERWTAVCAEEDLPMRKPTRVEFDGKPIMLFRDGPDVFALGATCAHAGGPLDEGKVVYENCIQCPWHDSVFDMRNGHIVHGPTTHAQPAFDARIRNGRIEIRRCQQQPCRSGNPEGHQFE
jgi:nitrite reductase/ring-hydroxylating ferredoxin subunit/uncharacterized membrane protein